MAKLAFTNMDTAEAATQVAAAIREELPSATGVTATVVGDPEPRSYGKAVAKELRHVFASERETVFIVYADARTPRPLRVQCNFDAAGRGAAVTTILFVTRIGRLSPGAATVRPGRLRSSKVESDAILQDRLNAATQLRKMIGGFLRTQVISGSGVLSIDAFVSLIPDPDGAFVVASNTPGRGRLGLGRKLDLARFVSIAAGIETALAGAPGAGPAPDPNAPLPAPG